MKAELQNIVLDKPSLVDDKSGFQLMHASFDLCDVGSDYMHKFHLYHSHFQFSQWIIQLPNKYSISC